MINIKHFSFSDSCSSFALRICSAWTGGNDIDTEGQFVWDHSNTTIGFYNWSPNNPTKLYLNIQDCIDIYRNGEWNDRHCSHFNPFICEKNIVIIQLYSKIHSTPCFILVKSLLYCMRVVQQPLLCKKEENNNYCVDGNRFLSKSQR